MKIEDLGRSFSGDGDVVLRRFATSSPLSVGLLSTELDNLVDTPAEVTAQTDDSTWIIGSISLGKIFIDFVDVRTESERLPIEIVASRDKIKQVFTSDESVVELVTSLM
ncbi:MAG TPA: hypothetical protein VFT49_01085 [Candidatus Saccharimonadales bacterium]|nr:hypothetical protein [Candidatus Saccharimonadales bacterium]